MTSILSMSDIGTLDRQIQQLHDYKPIPENEVKALCDKVSFAKELDHFCRVGPFLVGGSVLHGLLQRKFQRNRKNAHHFLVLIGFFSTVH